MENKRTNDNLRPGTKAVTLIEHELFILLDSEPKREVRCVIKKFQIVEIDSEPGWLRDDTGQSIAVIAIAVPDTDGDMQRIGIEIDTLLVAANDN